MEGAVYARRGGETEKVVALMGCQVWMRVDQGEWVGPRDRLEGVGQVGKELPPHHPLRSCPLLRKWVVPHTVIEILLGLTRTGEV